jgi:hypothetical protein
MVFDLFLLRTILLCIFLGQEELSLSWDEMLQIALDISHGIEYLHEGVCWILRFFSLKKKKKNYDAKFFV